MADAATASWRTIRYGCPVLSEDGATLGTVAEVLGSDAEDVFHGIRVRTLASKADVVVPSDDITAITPEWVATNLATADVGVLEPYNETATYHLASVGWLRRHLGWRRDSGSDEEPG
ncbi:MAG TPA: hypothetical protein VIR16_02355 [Candidatus Limnocylindrales bacterium]